MESIFKGSGVALVTPFNKDGSVDYGKLKELIEFQIKNQTDAIIVCGTTGESATLTEEEHKKVIETSIAQVRGRTKIIAGTGSNSTETAIKLSKEADEMCVDGLLIVTPYYNKPTQKGLYEHYTAIAKEVDTPIILYNVPSRTGVNLLPKTVKEIVENNNNIIAIKEASGNLEQIQALSKIKEALKEKQFDIYSGNDDQTLDILDLGGIGVISVIANILPKEMHDIFEYYFKGNKDYSRELHKKMLKLMKALFIETNPIPVKKALELMGKINGTVRLPLTELEEEHTKELIKEMKNYGMTL